MVIRNVLCIWAFTTRVYNNKRRPQVFITTLNILLKVYRQFIVIYMKMYKKNIFKNQKKKKILHASRYEIGNRLKINNIN